MDENIPIKNITDLDDYQEEALKTALFPPEIGLLYCAMGVLGESAELATVVVEVLERGIIEDPEFGTDDLHWLISELKKSIETCSVIEVLKKYARKGHYDIKPMPCLTDDERDRIRSEGGDLIWYAAVMARVAGWGLSDVAQENVKKLRDTSKLVSFFNKTL